MRCKEELTVENFRRDILDIISERPDAINPTVGDDTRCLYDGTFHSKSTWHTGFSNVNRYCLIGEFLHRMGVDENLWATRMTTAEELEVWHLLTEGSTREQRAEVAGEAVRVQGLADGFGNGRERVGPVPWREVARHLFTG